MNADGADDVLEGRAVCRSHLCAQVRRKAEKLNLSINFLGRKDHLDPAIQDYQVN